MLLDRMLCTLNKLFHRMTDSSDLSDSNLSGAIHSFKHAWGTLINLSWQIIDFNCLNPHSLNFLKEPSDTINSWASPSHRGPTKPEKIIYKLSMSYIWVIEQINFSGVFIQSHGYQYYGFVDHGTLTYLKYAR